jgi:hypothetical protein
MDFGVRLTRGGFILAAVFVLVALARNNALHAEQATNSPPSNFGTMPSDPALLDPNLFTWPQVAPSFDLDKLDLGKFRKDVLEPRPFDEIELGKYLLRLDTSRNVVDLAPHGLTDAPQTSDLLARQPGKKRSRGQKDYYGFTLTTPMH